MIEVKAENDYVQVTIPTAGMTAAEVDGFVTWLRLESIARSCKLTPESAWQMAEDIKSDWWKANERRFGAKDA